MLIKALIADDEYPAREEIRYCLKKYENIKIMGEAADYDEALELIKAINYDLVFLDIDFSVKSGIDLGKEIIEMEKPPLIVYITAHEEYALKAFEVEAVDYLLKPIDENKFDKTIQRVLKLIKRETKETKEKYGVVGNKISAEYNGKILLVDFEEIYYAFSDQGYVFIKKYEDKLITKYKLSSMEEKLKLSNFFRTGKSFVVNLDKIEQVVPLINGTCELIMSDKQKNRIPVSRRQAKELKKMFDI